MPHIFGLHCLNPAYGEFNSVSLSSLLLGFACSSPEERAEELTVFNEVGDPISVYPKEPKTSAFVPDEIEEEKSG